MHFGVEVSPIQFMNVFCEVTRRHIVPKTFWAEVNAHRLWLQNAHPGIVQGAGVVSGFDVFPPKKKNTHFRTTPCPGPVQVYFPVFFWACGIPRPSPNRKKHCHQATHNYPHKKCCKCVTGCAALNVVCMY